MSVFAIADLHLSLGDESKKMDVFGSRWRDYEAKLRDGWLRTVSEGDTVVIGGDISWAMDVSDALPDLKFINDLPGRKLLLEGNHDFWWSGVKKLNEFCASNGLRFEFLRNNAYRIGDICVCGCRGWYTDEREIRESLADSAKIVAREACRLRASLDAGVKLGGEPVVFMHFPPYFGSYVCGEFIDIMLSYGVKQCFFGHIHGKYDVPPVTEYRGVEFHIISGDYLNFKPTFVGAAEVAAR